MNRPECCQEVTKIEMGEHFCLKWNNHQENLTGIMAKLLDEQKFVDVSLVCEMKSFKAHQTVLSACSPYFQQVLEENPHPHPIVILRDVKECEMTALLQYMYRGEVNVRDHELPAFLNTARALQIRGLSDNKKDNTLIDKAEPPRMTTLCPQNATPTPQKRRRLSASTSDTPPNDRHSLECQQSSSPLPIICKSNQNPKPSSSLSTSIFPDNMSNVQYVETSTPSAQPAIKQELDGASTQSDEPFLSHHLLSPAEAQQRRSREGAGGGDQREWSVEYASDNRSYHSQKPDTPVFRESPPCNKELLATPNCTDTSRLDQDGIDGKPWNIKHFFDKVEGTGHKCRICGQIKKHVRNHYLKHFPEHHECRLCRRTYTRKDNLNSHLKRDHLQRVKSSGEAFPPMKRRGGKDYPAIKCFTPDIYSHVNYAPAGLALIGGPGTGLAPQPTALPGPMDLSLRSTSAPLHTQHSQPSFGPIYDHLHSIYNYLRH